MSAKPDDKKDQNLNDVVEDSESRGFMQKIADGVSKFANTWYGKATAIGTAATFAWYLSNAELVKDPKGGVTLSTQSAEASDLSKHYVKQSDRLYSAGDVEGGLAMARKALDADRRDWEAWTNVASGLLDKKQFKQALPYAQQAYRLKPKNCTVNYTLGLALAMTGNKQGAKSHLEFVSSQCPNFADTSSWLAYLRK